ncbi:MULTISPECIES: permease [Paenibacillus]|nr:MULTISPECIES: permease [Paenibacillus]
MQISAFSLKEMLLVIPPIFILLGILDTWVPKEVMMKYMGEKSGWKGIVLAFLIGSAAAGPLYGAFPVAAVLMKKGVKFSNILIFIGAWSTTKIPMLLFEMSALGTTFAITRLLIDIPGILIIAYLLEAMISNEYRTELYKKAEYL